MNRLDYQTRYSGMQIKIRLEGKHFILPKYSELS